MKKNKMNKKLINELEQIKSWMKFLDDQSNYNRSFHKSETKHLKLIREAQFDDPDDRYGSPKKPSDNLILGNDKQYQDLVDEGNFIVISTDINGGLHVTLVEAEDENKALEQVDNEMLTQSIAISEDLLMKLISKLSQYLPEDIVAGNEPDKPPFIDEPNEKVIDEDKM